MEIAKIDILVYKIANNMHKLYPSPIFRCQISKILDKNIKLLVIRLYYENSSHEVDN